MSDKAWKVTERKKCKALGGERTGPRGFGLPDCVGLKVALEVKHRTNFRFLKRDWEQAVENAARVGLPPVLAIKERGRGRDCVQMRLDTLNTLRRPPDPDLVWSEPRWWNEFAHFTVQIPWPDFVRLYHNAYTKEQS